MKFFPTVEHPFQCEWHKSFIQPNKPLCGKAAQFQQQIGVDTFWRLCAEHKDRLLQSYNDDFRANETPKWKPVK